MPYSGAGNFTNLPVFPSCHIYSYLGGRKKVHFTSVLLLKEKEEELKIEVCLLGSSIHCGTVLLIACPH